MKNKNKPSVYNIGFLGYGEHKASKNGKGTREYNLWFSMLNRCYSKKVHKVRPSYIYCSVNPRWHNFQNFCNDIPLLEGYSLWIEGEKVELDKDYKIKNNKEYSKDSCSFISPSTNMQYTSRNNKTYKGTNLKTRKSFFFNCVSAFAKKHNLSRSTIHMCIKGVYKQTGGWIFEEHNC